MFRTAWFFGLLLLAAPVGAEPAFPVEPELFIDEFRGAEGIGFNAEGRLFIGADRSLWEATPDGTVRQIAAAASNLGVHRIGPRDLLMADFGPTVALEPGAVNDGVLWRIAPDGGRAPFARGIADPNAILILDDGTLLVSDDFTDHIYAVDRDGAVRVWSDQIPFPNGLALSPDGSTLYVAQIFTQIETRPVGFADVIWALPVRDGEPAGEPRIVGRTGGAGGVDGLATDAQGRVYVAENQGGRVLRLDPETGTLTVIAEGMPNVASLAFGEGDFDRESIYATCTFSGGGKIWRIPVGARGRPLNR